MGISTDFRWTGQLPLGGQAKQISAARDSLGRLQLFYVGLNGHVFQNFQLQKNGVLWEGQTQFGQVKASQVVCVQDANQNLNLFYIGTGHHIQQSVQVDAANNRWQEQPTWTQTASTMAVIRDSSGILNVVYVATYGGLFRKRQSNAGANTWPENETPFGDVGPRQVCLTDGGNSLRLVYISATSELLRRSQSDAVNDTWSEAILFGTKAKQVTTTIDSLGFQHIFYADEDNYICHDWQGNIAQDQWQGRTPFTAAKGTQIAIARNSLDGLEAHYIGTDNGNLWRFLEDTFPNEPNNGNWSSPPEPRHDGNDKPVSAKQLIEVNNDDGRMELIYIGDNNDLFHDWERLKPTDFESNINQVLASKGSILIGPTVTINIKEEMIVDVNSGPDEGFTFQMNCASKSGTKVSLQQYIIAMYGKELKAIINNWPVVGKYFINNKHDLLSLPDRKLPAGYQLNISLLNSANGAISGVTFVISDNTGIVVKTLTKNLHDLGVSNEHIAPIVSFQFNIVGPDNGEIVIFSSGSGEIFYNASVTTQLVAVGHDDNNQFGVADTSLTAESSNIVYGTPAPAENNSTQLVQSFRFSLLEDH